MPKSPSTVECWKEKRTELDSVNLLSKLSVPTSTALIMPLVTLTCQLINNHNIQKLAVWSLPLSLTAATSRDLLLVAAPSRLVTHTILKYESYLFNLRRPLFPYRWFVLLFVSCVCLLFRFSLMSTVVYLWNPSTRCVTNNIVSTFRVLLLLPVIIDPASSNRQKMDRQSCSFVDSFVVSKAAHSHHIEMTSQYSYDIMKTITSSSTH